MSLEEKIVSETKSNKFLTISGLAKRIQVPRAKVASAVELLAEQGKINIVHIGPSKTIFPAGEKQ